jgi:hypothetical protein
VAANEKPSRAGKTVSVGVMTGMGE